MAQSQNPKRVKRSPTKSFKRPCRFFPLGTCTKGKNCTFLHDMPGSPNIASRRTFNAQDVNKAPTPGRIPDPLIFENLKPRSPVFITSRPTSRGSLPPEISLKRTKLNNSDMRRSDYIMKSSSDGMNMKEKFLNGFIDTLPPTETERINPSLPQLTINFDEGNDNPQRKNVSTSNLYSDNDNPSHHGTPSDGKCIPVQTPSSPALVPVQTPSKAFTRPCKYYSKGFCVKGAACTFLHSSQEMPPSTTPDKTDPETPKGVDPNKMYVRLCRYFVKGTCIKGKDCTFIHPTPEQLDAIISTKEIISSSPTESPRGNILLTLPSLTPKIPGPAQSPRLCLNANASPVRLSLGNPAITKVEQSTKMFTKVCRFFQMGKCLKGEQCTFIHEKIDPQILNLEEKISSLGENKRVSSPRFARVDNRGYDFPEMNDIEDYIVGCAESQTASTTHSNIAAVVLVLDRSHEEYVSKLLNELHSSTLALHKECDGNVYSAFTECHSLGCTSLPPEEIAEHIRTDEAINFYGREETLCQPRFGSIIRYLQGKNIIPQEICYTYQVEAVNPKYQYKYPYANVSMVFEKGDKGEKIEEVAIRGVYEEQHIVLDRVYWDEAFKSRVPPLFLPYYLTEEQLSKYPESRRTWFCGTHTLFVPVLRDAEFVQLNIGDEWPPGADVPSKYCASRVPIPSVYIRPMNSNILDIIDDKQQQTGFEPRFFKFQQETVI